MRSKSPNRKSLVIQTAALKSQTFPTNRCKNRLKSHFQIARFVIRAPFQIAAESQRGPLQIASDLRFAIAIRDSNRKSQLHQIARFGALRSGMSAGNSDQKFMFLCCFLFLEKDPSVTLKLGCVKAQAFFSRGAPEISLKSRVSQRNLAELNVIWRNSGYF